MLNCDASIKRKGRRLLTPSPAALRRLAGELLDDLRAESEGEQSRQRSPAKAGIRRNITLDRREDVRTAGAVREGGNRGSRKSSHDCEFLFHCVVSPPFIASCEILC